MLDRPLAAFDIETIPDPDVGRRVQGLEGNDGTIVREMVRLRREETDGRTEYPQLPFHRIVTIGVAWLDPESSRFKLGALGGEAMDEPSHLAAFFSMLRRARTPPRLISWNGGGFDLPVIRYRAMLHGIPAPELYRSDEEREGGSYQHRYHDLHVDLMDVLSGYGASHRVGLGRMCELLGIPGKEFLTESIYEHILRGDGKIVEEYCKLDCLTTLLVFLAWLVHTGQLTPERMRAFVEVMRESLQTEEAEGWTDIVEGLKGWPRWPERPEI